MPTTRLAFLLLVSLSQISSADDTKSTTLRNHSVSVTEFHWSSGNDAAPTTAEMIAEFSELRKKRKISSTESFIISSVERTKSDFKVIKTVDAGDERRRREMFIGTIVSVLIKPENGNFAVEISYLNTRLGSKKDENGFPIPFISQ